MNSNPPSSNPPKTVTKAEKARLVLAIRKIPPERRRRLRVEALEIRIPREAVSTERDPKRLAHPLDYAPPSESLGLHRPDPTAPAYLGTYSPPPIYLNPAGRERGKRYPSNSVNPDSAEAANETYFREPANADSVLE